MDYDKVSEMTGEKASKKAPEFKLNEVSFNGKNGTFVLKNVLAGKNEQDKYEKVELGSTLEVVMLKHRRSLFSFKKVNGLNEVKSTNEHNHKDDVVFLFGAKEKGVASKLREKYPELRTRQIVYAYLPERDEVVRLVVKGTALTSSEKKGERVGYYEYLGSFQKDEHCWQYVTVLSPVEESNDLGSYFTVHFARGKKQSDDQLKDTVDRITDVHTKVTEYDSFYKERNEVDAHAADDIVDELPTVEYPDGDTIDISDIPF